MGFGTPLTCILDTQTGYSRIGWPRGSPLVDGVYAVRGAVAWPQMHGPIGGQSVTGYAACGLLREGSVAVVSEHRFSSIDPAPTPDGKTGISYLAAWLNEQWMRYFLRVLYWLPVIGTQDEWHMKSFYRSRQLSGEPQLRDVGALGRPELMAEIWLRLQQQSVRWAADGELSRAIRDASVSPGDDLSPEVRCLAALLVGLRRHPPTPRPLEV